MLTREYATSLGWLQRPWTSCLFANSLGSLHTNSSFRDVATTLGTLHTNGFLILPVTHILRWFIQYTCAIHTIGIYCPRDAKKELTDFLSLLQPSLHSPLDTIGNSEQKPGVQKAAPVSPRKQWMALPMARVNAMVHWRYCTIGTHNIPQNREKRQDRDSLSLPEPPEIPGVLTLGNGRKATVYGHNSS